MKLTQRTFEFGVRIVKLCRVLDEKPGVARTLGRQLLRAGTSIGANVEEGQASQSRADFPAKYAIACKEARETHYWLRLLAASDVVPQARLISITAECSRNHRDTHHDRKESQIPARQQVRRVNHPSLFTLLPGGSFNNNATNARSANRNNNQPDNRNNNSGFRVASTLRRRIFRRARIRRYRRLDGAPAERA